MVLQMGLVLNIAIAVLLEHANGAVTRLAEDRRHTLMRLTFALNNALNPIKLC